jgi:hypothetical protein
MSRIKQIQRIPIVVYRSVALHWGWHATLKDKNGDSISRKTFMDNKLKNIYIKAHESRKAKISAENARIAAIKQARIEGDDITVTSEEEA